MPPPSPRSTSAHNNTYNRIAKKRIADLITIQVKKGIAGRNAIHFVTRNVDWECNPFKKDFTDAWCWPSKVTDGFRSLVSKRNGYH